jgi:hypothetical protein
MRLPDSNDTGTGAGSEALHTPTEAAQREARKEVAQWIDSDRSGDLPVGDGGLSEQAREWLHATDGATPEAAAAYDEYVRRQDELESGAPLPPSGEPATPANFSRSVKRNEIRRALAEFRELDDE